MSLNLNIVVNHPAERNKLIILFLDHFARVALVVGIFQFIRNPLAR
jgi:hypothetical protein